ncbi:type III pantothenate kinase [bacterium]|nr:type III pantothenate kinase [bacterium]
MLLVDVGNSSVTVASGPDELRIERHADLPLPDDRDDHRAHRALVAEVRSWQRRLGLPDAAITSVVPSVGADLMDALSGAWAVDHRADFPFGLALDDPAAVGADRYCNVAAAVGRGWTSALVVDAGTATTFDVLSEGVFVGGLIAPGLATAAAALGEKAARLDIVRPAPAEPRPAPDTVGAMAAGAYLTGLHGVAGTVAALLAACGDRPVVLTGGLAPLLMSGHEDDTVRAAWRHEPLWTLEGLALLARGNRDRS